MKRFLIFLTFASISCSAASRAAAAMSHEGDDPGAAAVRLVPERTEELLRRCLPQVDDQAVQAILDDPRLILYTEREMPKAYQSWDGALQGVHRPSYNISANSSEPFGNGNREFPWSAPAGTHRARNVTSFRFLHLPVDEQGKRLPVVWFRTRLQGDSEPGYGWRFPVGTVVGEVLMMRGKDQLDYTFELRVRTREQDDWAVNVFRPFPKAADLAQRIKQLRPDWDQRPALAQVVELLTSPAEIPEYELADRHPRKSFQQSMGVYVLPSLEDDELVSSLLTTTTFQSSLGEYWFEGTNGVTAAAPTTEAEFHVVPANYDAGFVEVDRLSCRRCHETVNQHVNKFQAGRDWYGRIRGSDGIFSFHPFDPSCISGNGFGQPVKMRGELVQAGVVEKYDPDKHDPALYARVPHLVE